MTYHSKFDPIYLPVNTSQHWPSVGEHCDEAVHQEDPRLVHGGAVGCQDDDAGDEHDEPGEEERTPSCSLPFGNFCTPQLLQTLLIAATHCSEIFLMRRAMFDKKRDDTKHFNISCCRICQTSSDIFLSNNVAFSNKSFCLHKALIFHMPTTDMDP